MLLTFVLVTQMIVASSSTRTVGILLWPLIETRLAPALAASTR